MKNDAHGGDIYEASKKYGIQKEEILDYSANINPLGLPERLKEILISNIDELVNYPDPGCTALKSEISRYLNIPEETIIIGNGASEVIFLLFEVMRPKKVLIPSPTFSEYSKAAYICDSAIEYFELKEQESYRLNMDELFLQITDDIEAIFICNPNNPTSTLVEKEELMRLIKFAHVRGVNIIIDEAFIELTIGSNKNSVVDFLKEYSNLFIIRAFTKLFAMPGLRLGYGIGNTSIIKKMWNRKMPWSVNSLACCAGKLLAAEGSYIRNTNAWLLKEKNWFHGELCRISGLKIFEPQTNFILIKILDDTLKADVLRSRMAAKGILIRDASNFMFLDDRFFRVAIKDRESNIRFLKILYEVLR